MEFDYVIVGSGFGGSECLRLSKKKGKVLVIEKGNGSKQKIFQNQLEF
jgi:cholesterol oxidase